MAKYIKTEQGYKTKEELAIQPDWNQNDPNAPDYVKNRPFYDARDKVEYTFDGNLEGKETLTAPFDENMYLVKVADEIPERSLIAEVSACWSTPFGLDGEESGFVNDAIVEEGTGVYAILGAAYYFSENAEVPFSKGLYLMSSKNEEDKWWISKISFTLYDVKKLDTKYLPDGIGSLVITTYPEEREILHFPHGLYEMLRESWNKRMAVDIKVYSFNDPYANNVFMKPHEIDSYQYEAAEDRFEIAFNNIQNAIYVNADGTVEYIILG